MVDGVRIVAIELRRGGWGLAIIALALASPLAVMRQYLWSPPGETWFALINLAGAGLLFFACASGVGGWIGSRAKRLQMSELLHGANRFGAGYHAINLTVLWGSIAGVLGAGFGWVILRMVPSAPFGPFPSMVVFTSLLAAIAAASAGYAVGAAWGHPIAPLVAATAVYLPMIVARNFGIMGALSPTSAPALIYGSSARVQPDRMLAWAYALWLACLVLALAGVVVWGRLRTRRTAVVAGILVTACLAAATQAGLEGRRVEHSDRSFLPVTPVCQQTDRIRVCVHPLDREALPRAMVTITTALAPISGLPGVPSAFYGFGLTSDEVPQGATLLPRVAGPPRELGFQVTLPIVSGVSPTLSEPATTTMPAASQVIVACVLAGATTPETCHIRPGGTREGNQLMRIPDKTGHQQLTTLRQEMEMALARFSALDPAQRTAWLHAHWSALVHGDISLDALP